MADRKRIPGGILAEGEVTGHAHRVGCEVYEAESGVREFEAPEGTTLTHEEHKEQAVAPGLWRSARVRELDELDEVRDVLD